MGNFLTRLEYEMNQISSPGAAAPAGSYTLTPVTGSTVTTTSTSPPVATCDSNSPSTTTTTTTTSNSGGGSVQFEGAGNSKTTQLRDNIFNSTTFSILFWIIVMFTAYKLGSAIFVSRSSENVSAYSRIIDIVLAVSLVLYLYYWYTTLIASDQDNILGYFISWTQEFFDDPWSLFDLVWFTIIFFTLVYILKVPMAPGTSPVLVHLVESKIWILYATFAIIYFFKYVLGIPIINLLFNNSLMNYLKNAQPPTSSIYDSLSKDFSDINSKSVVTTTTSSNTSPASCATNKQVFNVSNNLYTYEEAQAVCKAFDASLATYDQIEGSYNAGGEWCNYGWSEGQMAFFPTQKSTWSTLQKNPKTQNSCGRPGINGGYIANPYVRFGANCYGVKPKQPENWTPPSYEQPLDIVVAEEETDEYANLRNGVTLNSFNMTNWSKY